MNNERMYRPVEPSDLPRIQAGTLKAYWFIKEDYYPAKILSTRYGSDHRVAYLVSFPFGDGIEFYHIVVDVTPEKRWGIWSHRQQRFLNIDGGYGFKSKLGAEIAMGDKHKDDIYIVEWEIKPNE